MRTYIICLLLLRIAVCVPSLLISVAHDKKNIFNALLSRGATRKARHFYLYKHERNTTYTRESSASR